ncbi:MAG: alpha/beta fold hydrolase [Kistimonas sp.]|nr:alpha/beta fold hydrolase [Kistimonas sp.]
MRLQEILHHKMAGQGQVVVLLHGLFGSMDNLAAAGRSLADTYQTLAVDLRNHGRSFHSDAMSIELMAEDLLRLLDHLELPQVTLVGHSLGGKVAMQVALLQPERVRALVVGDIAPVTYPGGHEDVRQALGSWPASGMDSRQQADTWLAAFVPEPGVRQLLIKSLVRTPQGPLIWRMNAKALLDNYDSLRAWPAQQASFGGPVLFVKGDASDYIRPEHRAVIQRLFPAAQVRILAGAGHWLHADKPVLFQSVLHRFLASL